MSEAKVRANNKFNKEHTVSICIKLNKNTDSDIINYLNTVDSKMGTIKQALREKMLYDSMGT